MSSATLIGLSSALVISLGPSLGKTGALTTSSNPEQVPLQKYGGDPHGCDPHGDDPHDEQHDGKLPANKDRDQDKAPKDVYGGQYPNSQAPY